MNNDKVTKKAWRDKNKEHIKTYNKAYNATRAAAGITRTNPSRRIDKRTFLRCRVKNRYGITLDQYDQMVVDSGGRCDICRDIFDGMGREPMLDHCHTTGQVRGLLCHACNCALGHAKDSKRRLSDMIQYLAVTQGEDE